MPTYEYIRTKCNKIAHTLTTCIRHRGSYRNGRLGLRGAASTKDKERDGCSSGSSSARNTPELVRRDVRIRTAPVSPTSPKGGGGGGCSFSSSSSSVEDRFGGSYSSSIPIPPSLSSLSGSTSFSSTPLMKQRDNSHHHHHRHPAPSFVPPSSGKPIRNSWCNEDHCFVPTMVPRMEGVRTRVVNVIFLDIAFISLYVEHLHKQVYSSVNLVCFCIVWSP